jgi:hypothetical protein
VIWVSLLMRIACFLGQDNVIEHVAFCVSGSWRIVKLLNITVLNLGDQKFTCSE